MLEECKQICDLVEDIYKDFGFGKVKVKFSDRPEKRIGSDEIWDKSEQALLDALEYAGLEYSLSPGEGAFYGPKLEFVLPDAIGRDWQLGTLQVDLSLPERLNASYVDSDSSRRRPVMLHRALFGSLERFVGVLLEHYAGHLPLWLSPVQVVVATITSDADEYAYSIKDMLHKSDIRFKMDISSSKIGFKIRKYSLEKVPIILSLGKDEVNNKTVSVRRLGSRGQEKLDFQEFLDNLRKEIRPPY